MTILTTTVNGIAEIYYTNLIFQHTILIKNRHYTCKAEQQILRRRNNQRIFSCTTRKSPLPPRIACNGVLWRGSGDPGQDSAMVWLAPPVQALLSPAGIVGGSIIRSY